jgi:hypothetical protein
MAKTLTANMSKPEALALLQAGETTPEAYLAWDKAQGKAAKAAEPKQCATSLAEFLGDSPPMALSIGSHTASAKPTKFSTGSFGYCYSGKMLRTVNGKEIKFQVSLTCTVVNSKFAAK